MKVVRELGRLRIVGRGSQGMLRKLRKLREFGNLRNLRILRILRILGFFSNLPNFLKLPNILNPPPVSPNTKPHGYEISYPWDQSELS